MILILVRQRSRTEWTVAKDAQMRVGKWLQAAKEPSKTGRGTAQTRANFFLRVCWKVKCCWWWCWWWGENHCLRTEPYYHSTMWQQHWVLKNLLSWLSIYSSPFIPASGVWGKAGNRHSTDTHRQFQLDFQFLARPPYNETGFLTIITSILWLGKTNKRCFFVFICNTGLFQVSQLHLAAEYCMIVMSWLNCLVLVDLWFDISCSDSHSC